MLLQMADLERGDRIRELRESRHLTQEAAADAVGVTLRAYQEWEAGGGIKWDNVKKLAKELASDPDYVMNGPKGETPDLLGAGAVTLDDLADQLGAIQIQLAELVAALDEQAQPSRRGQSSRKSSASGKKRAAS